MNNTQLEIFRQRLLDERGELLEEMKDNNSFGLDENMNDSIGELSGYDNHPGDIATELYEREKDIGLRENQMHIFDLITEALDRIEQGTYGYCAECNSEIPLERLEAIPYAKFCIEHQPNNEMSFQRPIEEQFMLPPFGRNSFDGKENETEFDSEDSWQSVAKFGTSNTASDFLEQTETDFDHMYIESREPIGFVDQVEGFIITDMDGNPTEEEVDIVRNEAYDAYMENFEGEEGISEHLFDEEENR